MVKKAVVSKKSGRLSDIDENDAESLAYNVVGTWVVAMSLRTLTTMLDSAETLQKFSILFTLRPLRGAKPAKKKKTG